MQVLDIFNIYEEYKDKYPDVNYPELTEDNISYANDVDYWFAFNNEELYMEYDALIDKYRKYKLQESTKNFAALTNGAISVEKLLEHADQVNKNL